MYTIAVMGDVHGNVPWLCNMIEYIDIEGADEIIQVGDFGFTFNQYFISSLDDKLEAHNLTLKFVEGNHDDPGYLHHLFPDDDGFGIITDRIKYIPRGHCWNVYGYRLMGLGGAVSVDRAWRQEGLTWWPGERITIGDVMRSVTVGKVDIMFSHDCPQGVTVPSLRKGEGSGWPEDVLKDSYDNRVLLRDVVDAVKPQTLVHGHYHVDYTDVLHGDDYETVIRGLDCDGSSAIANVDFIELPERKMC